MSSDEEPLEGRRIRTGDESYEFEIDEKTVSDWAEDASEYQFGDITK